MNFSDFGIKDETELEQDEFSLSRPTFGKDNQLTVIGWKGKDKYRKYYTIKCSKCSEDPELFGDGVFKISKGNLVRGLTPCGCSSKPYWTENQYKTLVERRCDSLGIEFCSFIGDFNGNQTKLKLKCYNHGIWGTTTVNGLLIKKSSCPSCGFVCSKEASTKEDSLHVRNFMSTGKFKEGTKFWRSERLDTRNKVAYWNYTCPTCSADEYVEAGLCSGVFEGHISGLIRGILSCRCSDKPNWTRDQYEYRVKKKMLESKTTDEFLGFSEPFKNNKTKFIRKCQKHGEYVTCLNNYLDERHECPSCANQNQKECYINFVKDEENTLALKFGIAKDSQQRIKKQNSQSIFSIEQYGMWKFPTVKACRAAEQYIKKHLSCRFLTKAEMSDGYTETTSIANLEDIIKIYEDFGGIREL